MSTTKAATPAQFWAAVEAITTTRREADHLGFRAEAGDPEALAQINAELARHGLNADLIARIQQQPQPATA